MGGDPDDWATGVVELSNGTGTEIGRLEAAGVDGFGATHFVQTVDVTVLRIVEMVKELWTTWLPPEVIVFSTGQVEIVV